MTSWMMPAVLSTWFTRLTSLLDLRIQPLFQAILSGIFCTAERRRTASSWFRSGGIGRDFRRGYHVLGSVGRRAKMMATRVLLDVENAPALAEDEDITVAIDDTPSKRYGPKVEGA